jgi:hypothetical protein
MLLVETYLKLLLLIKKERKNAGKKSSILFFFASRFYLTKHTLGRYAALILYRSHTTSELSQNT